LTRFAFGQGGHFLCRKEGEPLNQNWIVENLNSAFSTWNGKLTELWGPGDNQPPNLLRAGLYGA